MMDAAIHADALILAEWLERRTNIHLNDRLAATKLRQLRLALEQASAAQLENYNMATRGWGREKALEARIAELEAENEKLRQRLEVTPRTGYDGISCRDETIKLQDAELDLYKSTVSRLEAENASLRARKDELLEALQEIVAGDTEAIEEATTLGIPFPDEMLAAYRKASAAIAKETGGGNAD